MTQLIVITGPIASGKTSVARALGARFSDAGQMAAVVDLDDVFFESLYCPSERRGEGWRLAQSVHGALVAAWLRSGVDAVIAHGPFLDKQENAVLLRSIDRSYPQHRVLLLAPFEVALLRVNEEPERVLSRDPQFLRSIYERFEALRPSMPPSDFEFDTTRMSVDEIVADLAASLVREPD